MSALQGESSVEIDAPIEEVYAVCEDVLTAHEWQDGLVAMEAVATDDQGRATLVDATVDAKIKTITTRQRFAYDPPHRVSWEQTSGELKAVRGAWELEDLGDGRTRATFRLEGELPRLLRMAARGPIEGVLRSMLIGERPKELAARVAADQT